jgi:hypothetical protein
VEDGVQPLADRPPPSLDGRHGDVKQPCRLLLRQLLDVEEVEDLPLLFGQAFLDVS